MKNILLLILLWSVFSLAAQEGPQLLPTTEAPNYFDICAQLDAYFDTEYEFVGTDIGVFYSDATTISWQPYGTGLPNVFVLDFALRTATHRLYIATHGRGVYAVPLGEVVATQTPTDVDAPVVVFPNPGHNTLFSTRYIKCRSRAWSNYLI
ncbi:MAG: hypothetical protein ABIQ93_04615 [Saprospiraceae bacterium]